MSEKYYCWIPILSHRLRYLDNNYCEDKCKRIFSDRKLSQIIYIDNVEFDNNGFMSSFVATLPHKYVITVQCEIKESGLVSFSFNINPSVDEKQLIRIKENIVVNLFDFIRDMYHEHVHHENADATLVPVLADNELSAVKQILEQYSAKIFSYHKAIRIPSYLKETEKSSVKSFFIILVHMQSIKETLESALGEFIYAQAFIDLHKNFINESEEIKKSFQRAYDSVAILKEKYSWKLTYWVSFLVLILTFVNIIPVIPFILKYIKFFLCFLLG